MFANDSGSTLDTLRRARASAETGPFSFHDWTCCTCGHLYVAAEGSPAQRDRDVTSPAEDTEYASVVVAVARALAGDERRFTAQRRWFGRRSGAWLATRWISDFTMARARRRGDVVRRADALAVLDEAIDRVAAAAPVADVHERSLAA